jgi:hypothetical protein
MLRDSAGSYVAGEKKCIAIELGDLQMFKSRVVALRVVIVVMTGG